MSTMGSQSTVPGIENFHRLWEYLHDEDSLAELLINGELLARTLRQLADLSKFIALDVVNHSPLVVDEVNQYGSTSGTSIFPMLGNMWTLLSSTRHYDTLKPDIIRLATRLAKIELNILASGKASYQSACFEHEPSFRKMIYRVTSGVDLEDSMHQALGATLVKILYNLFTPARIADEGNLSSEHVSSDNTRKRLRERACITLDAYLSGEREDNIIDRLLWSPDLTIIKVTFHLLIVLAQADPEVCLAKMANSPTGVEWIRRCFVRIEEVGPDEEDVRPSGIEYVTMYISFGLHSLLNTKFKFAEAGTNDAVVPSRIMLFKMIDRYQILRKEDQIVLASSSSSASSNTTSSNKFIVSEFNQLAGRAMRMANDVSAHAATLPSVFEAVVLVAEILTTIGEINVLAKNRKEARKAETEASVSDDEYVVSEMRKNGDEGIIKTLVVLLREMIKILPVEAPFNTKLNQLQPETQATITELPAGVPLDSRPFSRMKSTLVTLLTVLVDGDEPTADIVFREGGVHVILQLCQRDNRDEYLLEHATFALATLMKIHGPTRDLVREIQPSSINVPAT